MAEQASNAQRCPLCAGDNHCAVAQGLSAASCWCMGTTIDPAVLDGNPQVAGDKRCICRNCAEQSGEAHSEG